MAEIAIRRASLWREAWSAIKASAPSFWPWALGFGVVLAIPYFLMMFFAPSDIQQQLRANPQLFKQHPEIAQQYLVGLWHQLPWFILLFLIMSLGYYIFTVMYLRFAMINNCPNYSVGGYFYWLGKVLLKWLRFLWVLIPILGFFIYMRSILRYQLVCPLAALRHGSELKTSWNLTKCNWWRIFGNAFVLGLLLAVIIAGLFVISLIPIFVIFALIHLDQHSTAFQLVISLTQGLTGSVMMASFSIFSCTTYRILSQEAQQATALPSAAVARPA
jgi:hypothetical protein